MKANFIIISALFSMIFNLACNKIKKVEMSKPKAILTAAQILGNPNFLAISYGGYREISRDVQPTISQLKEDMRILSAMGIKIIRTYNVQAKLPHASNVLKAISELKKEDSGFEMYVMLGAWIDCLNAWTNKKPNHELESLQNSNEIERAVMLAKQYPDIVKVIAVGNEAMVKWASSYFVQPKVILKWVNHLQDLKVRGELSKDLWITSSDDFSSWGGGDSIYHTEDLEDLIKAVDYISMHTYPYHNTHYNPAFWKTPNDIKNDTDKEKIDQAMLRALNFTKNQYKAVSDYVKSIGVKKPIHIGETGWATISNGHYGANGSRATDEYKQGLYYKSVRNWSNKNNITCFYFEAFDEQWKDSNNPKGSENNFGLINLDGEAKFSIWNLVDNKNFIGLTRNGNSIIKTFKGDKEALMQTTLVPNTEYIK